MKILRGAPNNMDVTHVELRGNQIELWQTEYRTDNRFYTPERARRLARILLEFADHIERESNDRKSVQKL
jgi:hypothetical protein